LLSAFKQQIQEFSLIPSKGGCFELTVDGKRIYSKLETGKFPDEAWVLDTIGARLPK
jgi:selenoprotein W-related protein